MAIKPSIVDGHEVISGPYGEEIFVPLPDDFNEYVKAEKSKKAGKSKSK